MTCVGSLFVLVRFLYVHMPVREDFLPGTLLRGVILPHFCLFFGLALAGYGFVTLRHASALRELQAVAGRVPVPGPPTPGAAT